MLIKVEEINGPHKSSKGKWQEIELVYTEDGEDSTRTKTLVSFGDGKPAFDQLSNGEFGPGDEIEVELKKNGKYWNWVSFYTDGKSKPTAAKPAGGGKSSAGSAATKSGGWETPEERYKRNLTICRQNALTNAVATHANVGAEVSIANILEVAQTFFEWTTQNMVKEEDVSEAVFK